MAACINTSHYWVHFSLWLLHCLFILSLVDGHTGHLRVLAVANKAAMNICVQFFGMTRWYRRCMFNFLAANLFPTVVNSIIITPAVYQSSTVCSMFTPIFVLFSVFLVATLVGVQWFWVGEHVTIQGQRTIQAWVPHAPSHISCPSYLFIQLLIRILWYPL